MAMAAEKYTTVNNHKFYSTAKDAQEFDKSESQEKYE